MELDECDKQRRSTPSCAVAFECQSSRLRFRQSRRMKEEPAHLSSLSLVKDSKAAKFPPSAPFRPKIVENQKSGHGSGGSGGKKQQFQSSRG